MYVLFTHLITGIAGALYQNVVYSLHVVLFSLLCVSSLSVVMKDARGAGTTHIRTLWLFDKC